MYGRGELSKAFCSCRSGAVYGSTYMLRRPPLRITLEQGSSIELAVLSLVVKESQNSIMMTLIKINSPECHSN